MTAAIKCLVWDLDRTLWEGILLEDEKVTLRPNVRHIIQTLDGRGIIQSIASRSADDLATKALRDFGLQEYFLYPQINWGSKATSIRTIAGALNFSLDSMALIDDEPFERDEVRFELPEVCCLDAADLSTILDLPALNPRFVTADSKRRRAMYIADHRRNEAEAAGEQPREAFLATLDMRLAISRATEADLMRAEELTVRTHQLNTTGTTYSYEALDAFRRSDNHTLLIVQLDDRYGSYGKIGLALVERGDRLWTIKLLLMSCRVMNRGVGMIMINHLLRLARDAGVRLQADFVKNQRNRMMYVAYSFAGFREVEKQGDRIVMENDLSRIQADPEYVEVRVEGRACTGARRR